MNMGSIVTFYSYKGGVGRTMAVANIAVVLAQRGLRVLAVDWDLEAPGLHRYFADSRQERTSEGGLLEFLTDAVTTTDPLVHWRKYISTVTMERGTTISLIAAGRFDPEYEARPRRGFVGSIKKENHPPNWQTLHESFFGQPRLPFWIPLFLIVSPAPGGKLLAPDGVQV
jgi:MinD-like ATPase involved in chromosome partitioning or flagellar assembly